MNIQRHSISCYLLTVAVLLTALSTGVFGGTTGKLSGRVLDKNKEPLPSTNVVLVGTTLGAVTDVDGYYSILNIPPGRYSLLIRLVGYRSETVKGVEITVNNTTKVDAVLEDESITTDAVVVTAKRPVVDVSLTSTMASISDNDIKQLPVQDLLDIVNLQAGVVTDNGGGIHFRGGRDGEVQFQVNGVSVNNSYDNSSTIKIDRSLIQEVQVITGTFDAEYGQAMSGVVNTVLKSGSDHFQWNAEVLTGDFLYSSGGDRGLQYKFRPGSNQNYQFSLSGPTGLPETYFLFNGRRNIFDDYLWGKQLYVPTDTTNFTNPTARVTNPNGNGSETVIGYTREWSGLAKITNHSIPGVELSYQGVFNVIDGRRTSDGFAWTIEPDGDPVQKTISVVHGLDWTHTLSGSTFYNLSVRQNYFYYHDWVYDNFYDPRYDLAGSPISLTNYYNGANFQGVNLNRFEQKTNAVVVKGALTSQVTREHQIKVGGEAQLSHLQFGAPGTLVYTTVNGIQQLTRHLDEPPDYPGVQTYDPLSFAGFAQDQIEWNDLTIRAGVRFEYFDARSYLPSDLANPADSIQGAPQSVPRRTTVKTSFAPRLGVSYPITTRSSIYFSYGHFYQLPPLRDIFSNANYAKLATLQQTSDFYSQFGVLGNPDIKPERTVQYEFGYKNAVTDFLGISVNLFYKDIRDLLGTEFISTYNDAQYARLTNIDFGNVTGVTLSLDQRRIGIVSSTLDYTFQIAQGNSSTPQETAVRLAAGLDPRPRQIPFNWDQRHTLNLTVQFSDPDNYSLSTILRYASGQPYTPDIVSLYGAAVETNSARKPDGLVIDMRGEKNFTIAGLEMSFFVRVFNLLNAAYFNGPVFSSTGSPYYSLKPTADRNTLADPTRFIAPRRFEIGISSGSSF